MPPVNEAANDNGPGGAGRGDGPLGKVYTLDEAAGVMRVSRRNLQEICKQHPYYFQNGNRKLFTSEDIKKIIEAMRPCPTSSTPDVQGLKAGISEAPTHQEKKYSDLLKPRTRRQPRR